VTALDTYAPNGSTPHLDRPPVFPIRPITDADRKSEAGEAARPISASASLFVSQSRRSFLCTRVHPAEANSLVWGILRTWHHALHCPFIPTHVLLLTIYHHRIEGIKSDLQVQKCEDRWVVALRVAARAAFHQHANFWPSCFVLTHRSKQGAQHLQIPLEDQ
jgi:hypothetical protein